MRLPSMGAGDHEPDLFEAELDRVACSAPFTVPTTNRSGGGAAGVKSARFNLSEDLTAIDDDVYLEIMLDVSQDFVAVRSVKPAGEVEDLEVTLIAEELEKKGSFGASVIQSASARFRRVSRDLRRLAPMPKRPATAHIGRSRSAAEHALQGLKFISKTDGSAGWRAVERRFDELAIDGELSRALFGQCIGMKESKEFAGELFDALARKRNLKGNSIGKEQLREFWDQISDQSFDSRLQTFFDMVDKNADGRITEEEVKEIISLSASANKLSKIQEQAEEYARLIMEELDPGDLGYIEIHNLETLLLQAPSQSLQLGQANNRKMSEMLSHKLRPTIEPNPIKRYSQRARYFLEDNLKRVWIVGLWLGVCSGLFAWKFVQYRERAVFHVMGYCVCVAKGGAETLKFNMALILLPVCRNTITWLRNKSKLGVVVPFDDNLNFHKVIAVGISVGVGLHAISHLTCDFPRLLHASDEDYAPMKPYFGETRPANYWLFVRGIEGWTGIIMVILMAFAFTLATPCFRRGRLNLPKPFRRLTGFNAFWYSHHLFIIVYSLLIIHGFFLYLTKKWYKKTTWMYLAIPVVLYASERLLRVLRSSVRPVKILKVAVYPGNVLALHVSKPPGFRYKSGQYIFVNCAAVSPFEWHPFSITSAPQDDYLSVHIRTLGDWTRQLRTVFSEVCQPSKNDKSGLRGGDYDDVENSPSPYPNFPRVLIDGPYGAPAQDYKKYEVVLLVGLGIGATPFISILKDILNNLKLLEAEIHADCCIDRDRTESYNNSSSIVSGVSNATNAKRGSRSFKTRRAYFFWVTREQGSFEWFKGVMNEVAEEDKQGAIELHNYCTSVYEEGDARSALIAMLQSLNLAKHGVDVVSGTRVKSHFARPNWRNVYKRLALNHPDKRIGVFYCGAAGLTKELRQLALDFSRKTTTKFDFHKENF